VRSTGGRPDRQFRSVSCIGTTFCEAVGVGPNGQGEVMVQVWNGATWTEVTPLGFHHFYTEFNGVSCVSTTYCAAVGDQRRAGKTFVLVASPATGQLVLRPRYPVTTDMLRSVSCVDESFCMAVGTLMMSWHGGAWSVSNQNGANGVSCVSATLCMAVGNIGHAHVKIWNGTTWTRVIV
jgi:hypothetical protein